MAFRFVHTADVHLDSPLKSLALRDPTLANLVEQATRDAFRRIIDLCLEEHVDALLIAGDLYDGANTSMKTAAFLASQVRRLPEDTRVCLIKGNHDAQSSITRRLDLGPNVLTFDGRGGVREFESRDGDRVALHGVSFADRHAPESLLPKYGAPVAGAINVGLMHTSLDGSPYHDPYAPVALEALMAHGYAYWALGHIHKRRVETGAATVVMPGIPQGRHVNEPGPKSVTLVTVTADGVKTEERPVAGVEFGRIDVFFDDVEDMDVATTAIAAALGRAREAASTPCLILRPRLTGITAAAWRFRRDAALVAETARETAAGLESVWIEDVEFALSAPTAAGPTIELDADVEAVLAAPGFADEATDLLEELAGRLPRDIRDAFGATPEDAHAIAVELARDGADDALVRLAAPDAEAD